MYTHVCVCLRVNIYISEIYFICVYIYMFLHRDTAAPEAKIVYYPSQVAFTKAPSKAQLF